jgi:hypothetical protein
MKATLGAANAVQPARGNQPWCELKFMASVRFSFQQWRCR